jgi:SAM-dependent methyltransferase
MNIPFFFQSNKTPYNEGFPQSFQFDINFNQDWGMFVQTDSEALRNLLKEVYEKGTLADGSFSSESGKVYLEKVIEFIASVPSIIPMSNILEVGFGSGILLKLLKAKGFKKLTGLEPGAHSLVDGLDGIQLIKDFFPSAQISSRFDLIYSLLVLEHIPDPVAFLNKMKDFISPEGTVVIAVPNCEAHYEAGDIGMFVHEHYGYYTREALIRVAELAGYKVSLLSTIEGVLISSLRPSVKPSFSREITHHVEEDFWKKVKTLERNCVEALKNLEDDEIAVYAPIRGMNILSVLNRMNVRLIDDNEEIQGNYLPGFSKAIESFECLCIHPPKLLLICSRTFGDQIKEKCVRERRLEGVRVILINDLTAN